MGGDEEINTIRSIGNLRPHNQGSIVRKISHVFIMLGFGVAGAVERFEEGDLCRCAWGGEFGGVGYLVGHFVCFGSGWVVWWVVL